MVRRIDHIGIAVHNLDKSLEDYLKIFGLKPLKIEMLEDIFVRMAFIRVGEVLVELLEPTSPGAGRIGAYLKEKGEGIHHIAYRVDNIEEAMKRLISDGVKLRDAAPRNGGDNSRIAFIEPECTQNVLTELVEREQEVEGVEK